MLSLQNLYKNCIKKELPYLVILIILIIMASAAMFHEGFFRTYDDVTTVRILDFVKELQREGWYHNFPIRISAELSHGFGYSLYLFYGNLPYYVGALIMMLTGLNHISVTKLVYLFPLVVGPILFYTAARFKMKPVYALIASCLYTLFPYRGFDIYLKGGTGEAWSIAFIPGIFIGLFLLEKKKIYAPVIFALFLLLSMISHPLAGLQALVLAFFYGLIIVQDKKLLIFSTLLGIGLAAFSFVPSFYYLKIVQLTFHENNKTAILDQLLSLQKLVVPALTIDAKKPFSALFLPIILVGLIVIYLKREKIEKNMMRMYLFFGLLSLVFYLLLGNITRIFWILTLPISGILQTPSRLFTIISFTLPFFIGLYLPLLKNKLMQYGVIITVLVISFASLQVFKPIEYSYYYEYAAEGPCATTTWQDEYLPIWVKTCPPKELQANMVMEGDGKLVINKNSLLTMDATVINNEPSDLIVHRYYFPGWDVYVDGTKSKLDYTFSPYGIFKTKIPEGKHEINVKYQKTPVMVIADVISLVSFVFLILFALKTLTSSFSFPDHGKNHRRRLLVQAG
ncbi:hypothetical protein A3A93_04465 [Candidatus Roizmanbacteria bacterium RIFCSPLOWO2_01_FULL_38_12]|uniref:Membrane protein 6-pyruvoyl-tetrahydropterin synthase-related domain-containing protein n=1 Tax=Candidatus Roizmanbacteria bacterium RIFCSPLOWO2_01_FULL_38_12 TaxID=1802061 RepID=A0A1F7IXE6_9BACT|nr:MAG: hypothetical protein A2861_01935 [Candidatus Roizmanbacteria bacterium RIFCSPHIGHO2_01_FULL_38_15]OGK35493.1 MAG: hypothetical protein A3F59_00965 [Candidatus Roizmanbacteria bacterium RIFCSPHIGHO2_12_FULL_38_13]OGK48023.1 MAG: hypothetical protein A3A93_04465 [Candidatus Roizmanbacteria bacterium RIFCSPLOWO2_01_FULL_38_12]